MTYNYNYNSRNLDDCSTVIYDYDITGGSETILFGSGSQFSF